VGVAGSNLRSLRRCAPRDDKDVKGEVKTMSTLVSTLNLKRGWGSGVGRFLLAFGVQFTLTVSAVFLVAVVILIGLFLANVDSLFAGLLGVEDAILIPVQDNNALTN
jgi:hypothetical protein